MIDPTESWKFELYPADWLWDETQLPTVEDCTTIPDEEETDTGAEDEAQG